MTDSPDSLEQENDLPPVERWERCDVLDIVRKGLKPQLLPSEKIGFGDQMYKLVLGSYDSVSGLDEGKSAGLSQLEINDAIMGMLKARGLMVVKTPQDFGVETANKVYFDREKWEFYATKYTLEKLNVRQELDIALGGQNAPRALITNVYSLR